MKHTHPKKANIIAGLLSLCLSLLCPMAKGDNAIYTLHGRTLIINEGVKEVNRKDLPLQIDREITKVELPSSLQKIGKKTFMAFSSLKGINLPPSLAEIGDSAFHNCRRLKKIEIPNAVSRIGTRAFEYCEGINQVIYYDHGRRCYGWAGKEESCPQKIIIPQGVTAIDNYAFRYTPLRSIDLPSSLTEIGDEAFSLCEKLEEIEIPRTIQKIGTRAFEYCKGINQLIYYDKGRRCYGWAGKNDSCPKEIVIPNGVIAIDDYAFKSCTAERIILPEGLESIGKYALNSYDLKGINLPSSVDYIGDYAIEATDIKIDQKSKLLLYANNTKCYGWVGDKDSCPKEIVIPEGVTYINKEAFLDNPNITKMVFPESLRKINESVLARCRNLETVVLSTKLDTIEQKAFEDCDKLKNINIPNDCEIRDRAFQSCDSLNFLLVSGHGTVCRGWTNNTYSGRVLIPQGIKIIAPKAFSNCSIGEIILPEGLDSIGTAAFSYCHNLEEIKLPNSVRHIGEVGIFERCDHLKRVHLSDSLPFIPPYMFFKCTELESIEIPNSVTSIGHGAFANCSKLERVRLPEGISEITYGTFSDCVSLKEINWPSSLKEIKSQAFGNCPKRLKREIPRHVDVHRDAFEISLITKIAKNVVTICFFSFGLAIAVILLMHFFHSHKKYSWMKSIVIVLFIALGIVLLLFIALMVFGEFCGGLHG